MGVDDSAARDGPQIRASWTRFILEYYEAHLAGEARAALDEALPGDLRARLLDAGPFEWLGAEVHMRVLPAPLGALGPEEYRRLWRRLAAEGLDRPLFRAFVRGTVALFRGSPGKIFLGVPKGFGLIARGCGELSAETEAGERSVRVSWLAIPPILMRTEAFPIAWAATLDAVLSLAETPGSVTIESVRPTKTSFLVTW